MAESGKMCESTRLRNRFENDAINDNGVLRRETELDVHAGMYNYLLRRRSVMPPALPQQLAGSR